MRILFVTKEMPYPITTGAHMRTWHYIQGLIRTGGKLDIVCFGRAADTAEGVAVLSKQGVSVRLVDLPESLTRAQKQSVYALVLRRAAAFLSPLPFAINVRRSSRMRKTIAGFLGENSVDVVICDGIHMALNVPLSNTYRTILDEHNVESTIVARYVAVEKKLLYKIYGLIEWVKFCFFENSLWKKFDEIHVCSDVDKKQVEARCGHKNVRVVPNGVDIDPAIGFDRAQKARPQLVYSGIMGWQPNEDAAVYFFREIYPRIKREIPDVSWCIVGKDPSKKVLALQKQDLSIIVTGSVPDVKPYVLASTVVVIPLRMGSGTRLKILEAMAMVKPVVSTTIGCEGIEVEHGKNIMIVDESAAFAEMVVRLIQDEALRENIAQAGRRLVEEKYDWHGIEKTLADLIAGTGRLKNKGYFL